MVVNVQSLPCDLELDECFTLCQRIHSVAQAELCGDSLRFAVNFIVRTIWRCPVIFRDLISQELIVLRGWHFIQVFGLVGIYKNLCRTSDFLHIFSQLALENVVYVSELYVFDQLY